MFRKNRGKNRKSYNGREEKTLYSDYIDTDRDRGERDHDRKKDHHMQGEKRVSFKPSERYVRNKKHQLKASIVNRLRDADDEEMVELSNNIGLKRDKPRRNGSPIPIRINNTSGWYQVAIPYGQKYDKATIMNNILNFIAPHTFTPLYWLQESGRVVFYLDNYDMASRLQQIDRKIRMPDGYKLLIKIRNAIPTVNMNDMLKEKIKFVMAKRYNATTKALDLSKFHADEDLKDVFCGLMRPAVMLAALDIMSENIPDLEALNLNDNIIMLFDQLQIFRRMSEKLPNLKILYLDGNKIHSISQLNSLRSLNLIELAIKRNPFMKFYPVETEYISEMQKKFPKLKKLDGQELKPLIGFEVMDPSELPPPKASFLIDSTGADIVRQFIQQYFAIFDSNNRQPLIDAYHEHAMLSLSSATSQTRLAHYAPYCRNLKSYDPKIKNRLIRYGKLPAISLLIELPKTQHDPQSFTVDLTLYTPKMISFTVTGIFKELTEYPTPSSSSSASSSTQTSSQHEIRSFARSFVIIPWGNGYCIRNELILISNVTSNQLKTAFKPIDTQQASSPSSTFNQLPSTSTSIPTSPTTATTTIPDDSVKLQMIQAMAEQSHMNLEWSKKCLEETNWNFNHAVHAFNELQKQNKIPPEAFVK